jgi:hypothetical protein
LSSSFSGQSKNQDLEKFFDDIDDLIIDLNGEALIFSPEKPLEQPMSTEPDFSNPESKT